MQLVDVRKKLLEFRREYDADPRELRINVGDWYQLLEESDYFAVGYVETVHVSAKEAHYPRHTLCGIPVVITADQPEGVLNAIR